MAWDSGTITAIGAAVASMTAVIFRDYLPKASDFGLKSKELDHEAEAARAKQQAADVEAEHTREVSQYELIVQDLRKDIERIKQEKDGVIQDCRAEIHAGRDERQALMMEIEGLRRRVTVLETIQGEMPFIIYYMLPNGRYIDCSPRFVDEVLTPFGITLTKFLGSTPADLWPPSMLAIIRELDEECLRNPSGEACRSCVTLCPDKLNRHATISKRAIYKNGRLTMWCGAIIFATCPQSGPTTPQAGAATSK